MKSIIEILYLYVCEKEGEFFQNHLISEEEHTAYTAVQQFLTKKQQEELNRYQELFAKRHFDHKQEVYSKGFEMGVKLALELFDTQIL